MPLRLESLQDTADRTGLCVKTIRRRIADGTITGYKVGDRAVRVNPDEVDDKLIRVIPTVGGPNAA
jgi:excisionase family DNA binding protein